MYAPGTAVITGTSSWQWQAEAGASVPDAPSSTAAVAATAGAYPLWGSDGLQDEVPARCNTPNQRAHLQRGAGGLVHAIRSKSTHC